ncbi:hypothetical protein [Falsigemmobacter faecalis]|uniref:Uncharacterized protein n=1 Tax=Falsigemmobacter faecalis TaxID=2488730 RepID=A0A3P3DBS1_9RHOB|nr:hypothetical protein [Falsigemmobacter faecalis]RRH71274.1 hypothetical protein EG244_16490 [Falsigemmobacter faecalis]
MLGLSLGLAAVALKSGGSRPNTFTPLALFGVDQPGYWASGYTPVPFTPSLLLNAGAAGHWAGDLTQPAFTPDLLLSGRPGHWSNIKEARQ